MSIQKPSVIWKGAASQNFTRGRSQSISRITFHHIVGDAAGAINRFNDPSQEVSSNYVIGSDGTIYQCVNDSDTAYCDANFDSNSRTISIEHAGGHPSVAYTPAMYEASAQLCAYLINAYSIGDFKRHREVSRVPTACCGDLNMDGILTRARQLITEGNVPVPQPVAVGTAVPSNGYSSVVLPSYVETWRLYRVGSLLRPNTEDQLGVLRPSLFGGLTYKIVEQVGDKGVIIDTQDFGRGVIWTKDTDARFIMESIQPKAIPTPPPVPVAIPVPVAEIAQPVIPTPPPLYTIEPMIAKVVKVIPSKNKWNLAQPTLKDVVANPITKAEADTHFTAVAILTYKQTGSRYYLEDANTPHGYNVVDCSDYVAPSAAHLPVAPVTAPSDERYELIVPVAGYATSNRAVNHDTPTADLIVGTYFVFSKRYDGGDPTKKVIALNLTTIQGQPDAWINPDDNVPAPPPPPVVVAIPETTTPWADPRTDSPADVPVEAVPATPEPPKTPAWQTSYKPFKDDQGNRIVRSYIALHPTLFKDAESKLSDKTMADYVEVKMSGTFVKDNITYLRPTVAADRGLWYGAQEIDPTTGFVNLELYDDGKTTIDERQALGNTTFADYVTLVLNWLRGLLKLTKKG